MGSEMCIRDSCYYSFLSCLSYLLGLSLSILYCYYMLKIPPGAGEGVGIFQFFIVITLLYRSLPGKGMGLDFQFFIVIT